MLLFGFGFRDNFLFVKSIQSLSPKEIRAPFRKGETPVFLACGITPQMVVMKAKPDFCIAHVQGYMFISDILNEEFAVF